MTNTYILGAIVLSALATCLPRILPYLFVRFVKLPEKVIQFFNYLPISIIFALLLSSVVTIKAGQAPVIKWVELIAVFPTLFTMLKTKNVLLTVLVGCVTVAFLRLIA